MAALEQALDGVSERVADARKKTQEAHLANVAVFDSFEALVAQYRRRLPSTGEAKSNAEESASDDK